MGGWGRTERKPRMCPLEQGRTSECTPGLSKNLGVYSRSERHGDGQTTGDWQFEEKIAWGEKHPQIANLQWSVCRGGLGPTEREPRMCSDEQGGLGSE